MLHSSCTAVLFDLFSAKDDFFHSDLNISMPSSFLFTNSLKSTENYFSQNFIWDPNSQQQISNLGDDEESFYFN